MSLSTPTRIPVPFAISGLKATIPASSNNTTGRAGYDLGFPSINMTPKTAGGIPPFGQDFNGIFYDVTTVLQYMQAGSGFVYNSAFSTAIGGYKIGATIPRTDGAGFWLATVDATTTDPEVAGADAAGWRPVATTGITAIAMTNANVTLTPLQWGKGVISITGALVGNLNLILPTMPGQWLIVNGTTGAFTITAKTAAGTGVLVTQGAATPVYGDGTNIGSAAGAGSTATAYRQVQPIPTPTLSANALTIPSAAYAMDFRKATLTAGGSDAITGSPAALIVPAGATLGTVSAVASSVVVVLLNNASTLEYAVINLMNGVDLSETGVISTTAITAGSTAANVFYSNTARTGVPYRVIARFDSTQTTAGQWATAPSLVIGAGGNALAAMSSIGYGQTWQTVTRNNGTTYYNTTGKPIMLIFGQSSGSPGQFTIIVNGVTLPTVFGWASAGALQGGSVIIPAGASYSISAAVGTATCGELR